MPFLVIFQILAPDFHTIRNFRAQNGAKIDQLGIVDPSSILTSILDPIRSGQKSFESSDPRGSDRGSSTPSFHLQVIFSPSSSPNVGKNALDG